MRFLFVFAFTLFLGSASHLQAQIRTAPNTGQNTQRQRVQTKPFEERTFKERIWWGSPLILSFSGSNVVNEFTIGIAPTVGYQVFPNFSIGPRATLIYTHLNFKNALPGGENFKANPLSWGVGAFARYNVFQGLFIHGEYEYLDAPWQYTIDPVENDIDITRLARSNLWLGGGYVSPGPVGFEIMGLYNVIGNESDFGSRFILRTGVVVNY